MTYSQAAPKQKERPVGVPAARGHGGNGGVDIRSAYEGPRTHLDSGCD